MLECIPKWQHMQTGLRVEGDGSIGGGTETAPAPDPDKAELDNWRQFGLTPEQTKVALEEYMRLTEEEKRWKEQPKEKPVPTKPATKEEDLSVKIRDEVIRAIPELARLKDLDGIVERLDGIITNSQQRDIEGARRAVTSESVDFVKGLNIDLSTKEGEEIALAIGEQVEKEIYSDPKLLARFTKGDRTVAEEAIERVGKSRLITSLNIPRKVEPRRPFSLGKSSGGDPVLGTITDSVAKLPAHQRFAALATGTYDHVFHD